MTSILQNKQGVPSAPVSTQWATSRLWIYTRGLLWLVGIRFGLRLLLVTLAWHRGDPSPVVDFLFDDSYLHAVVARNFASTGVSTFDGVTLTSGYQPLWFLLMVGLAKVSGGSLWLQFALTCTTVYALVLCVLTWLWRQATRARDVAPMALCFGLCSMLALASDTVFIEGLESVLFLPLAVWLIALLERHRIEADALRLSVVLALMLLARLDALAVTGAVVALYWLGSTGAGTRARVATIVRLASVPCATAVAYFALNYVYFGTAVPVSGLAKAMDGGRFDNWAIVADYAVVGLTPLFFAFLPRCIVPRSERAGVPSFIISARILAVAAFVQYLYYATQSTWPVWPWNLYIVYLLVAVLVARIVVFAASGAAAHSLSMQRMVTVLFMVGALLLGARSVVDVIPAKTLDTFNEISLAMLARIVPAQHKPVVVAMGDRGGGLAYWGAGRVSVVQTEGLTMDLAYLKARQLGNGAAFLANRFDIDYYAVDREIVPTYSADGETVYVVADPIQGRVTTAPVPTFCFPESAVIYRRSYLLWHTEPAQRLVFSFSARVPCPDGAMRFIQTVARGEDLRRLSLPSESR